jgi:hypothetical protein
MRTIGRKPATITALPGASGLHEAALHQRIASALAGVHSTGIPKGVYRFKTPEQADAQRDEALAQVMAASVAKQRLGR